MEEGKRRGAKGGNKKPGGMVLGQVKTVEEGKAVQCVSVKRVNRSGEEEGFGG